MTFPIGRRLKAIRALYNISQTDLAQRTGIDRPRLSNFESGLILLPDEKLTAIGEVLREQGVEPQLIIKFPLPKASTSTPAA